MEPSAATGVPRAIHTIQFTQDLGLDFVRSFLWGRWG